MAEGCSPSDVLSRLYDAFNVGDYEAAVELLAPEVEYHELPGMLGAKDIVGVYRGRQEVMRWLGEFLGEWETFRSEPEHMTELGAGQVLVTEKWRGRSRHSGVDVAMTVAALYTVRDGQIARQRYFRSPEEARLAARDGD